VSQTANNNGVEGNRGTTRITTLISSDEGLLMGVENSGTTTTA